jgi:hypothetical protein
MTAILDANRQKTRLEKQPRGSFKLRMDDVGARLYMALGASLLGIGFAIFSHVPFRKDPLAIFRTQDPLAILWMAIGLLFTVRSLYLVRANTSRVKEYSRMRQHHLSKIWQYDHPWSSQGISDEAVKTIAEKIWIIMVTSICLTPLLVLLIFNPRSRARFDVWFTLASITCTVILSGGLIYAASLGLSYFRFGTTRVHFTRFPFYLGENLDVVFEGGDRLAHINGLYVTLRCVEEKLGIHPNSTGRYNDEKIFCYQIYCNNMRCDTDGQGRARISFPLPVNQPSNQLIDNPPTYWELVVRAPLPGVEYKGTFLLPIYQRDST